MTRFYLSVAALTAAIMAAGAILAWTMWKIGGPSDHSRR